jgi:isopenicillin N synthase-like dioxygenase
MTTTEVPVIDIGPLVAADPDAAGRERVVAEIGQACRDIGFFYVANHGVPEADTAEEFDVTKRFFKLPLDDKMSIRLGRTEQFRGFVPLGGEVTGGKTDWHECVDLQPISGRHADTVAAAAAARRADAHPLDDPDQWPPALPEFRDIMMRAWDQRWQLSRRIAAGIALSLGLDEDFFRQFEGVELSDLRLVHYPPYSEAVEGIEHGFGEHVDYGFLAVLAQDEVGGLEVLNTDGDWLPARHIPGTFLVNVGLMMQRWTNDQYRATWHRVRLPGTVDRYSVPFFFEPAFDAVVEPLPICTDPPHYQPIQFGPYVVDLFSKAYD